MSKTSIFSAIPKLDYEEKAETINKEEFIKTIKSRRSIRSFTSEKVEEKDMMECLELALLAPTSSNLQCWEFYWVKDPSKKEQLKKYCLGQPAASTAQELVVCVARTDTWKENAKQIVSNFENSERKVPKAVLSYYRKIVPLAYNQGVFGLFGVFKRFILYFRGIKKVTPREPTSNSDMRVWAHKTTALACENLMLSLRAYGYDSCPMEGMDSKRIKALLNLPSGAEICMVISAGKRASNGVYGKRLRLKSEKFIKVV